MKTFKHILNYKNLISLTSFISAVFLSFGVISPAIANVKQNVDTQLNCIQTVFPDNVERDIVVDPDGGIVLVGYEENGLRKEITLSLKKNARFSDCNSGAKEIITLAQNIADKINTDTCKELSDIISTAQTPTSIDNKKMDIKATNNYIANHCK